jgi:hypothetical protein
MCDWSHNQSAEAFMEVLMMIMYDLSSLLTYIISFHQFGRHMWIDLAVVRINSYKSNVFQSKFLNCLARPHPSLARLHPTFPQLFTHQILEKW